jgi:hypothetical protein
MRAAVFLAAIGLPLAAIAATPLSEFTGRYSRHFLNRDKDWHGYWSDDVVELVPVGPTATYFRISLQYMNSHECDVSGVARMSGGMLVYAGPTPVTGSICKLTISRKGNNLSIDDADGTCSYYCGARGTLSRITLPLASYRHRPITYLPLLRSSEQYARALEAWHASQQGRLP